MNNCFAVIFDLDGVIVQTTEFHFKAWREFFSKRNIDFSFEQFIETFGSRNYDVFVQYVDPNISIMESIKLSEEKESLFRNYAKGKVEAIDGAVELIYNLNIEGIKLGLATSTPRKNLEFFFRELNIGKYFLATVCEEEVVNGKPNPEIFLKCAQELNVAPEVCVVVEDSPQGVMAARRAKMACVAYTTTNPGERLLLANAIVNGPTEVDISLLYELVEKNRGCE
jgi:HAD superfamily hydrolase (TIGR01509 family)